MRILLVEDDLRIGENLSQILTSKHYLVDWATTITKAEELIFSLDYDLLIIDWMLPDGDGVSLCRSLRGEGLTMPILIMTARSQVEDKVDGLNAGADDYITKPFVMEELLARIRALLRRNKTTQTPLIMIADLEIDTNLHQVRRQGKLIPLSPKEYSLFEYLLQHPGQALSREEIFEHVWGEISDSFSNTVDVHIRFLRQKLPPELIKTIKGKGYALCPD